MSGVVSSASAVNAVAGIVAELTFQVVGYLRTVADTDARALNRFDHGAERPTETDIVTFVKDVRRAPPIRI